MLVPTPALNGPDPAPRTFVAFLHSTVVPEDQSAFCVVSASSAEFVVEA